MFIIKYCIGHALKLQCSTVHSNHVESTNPSPHCTALDKGVDCHHQDICFPTDLFWDFILSDLDAK